jgi:hypothetical protein
MSEQARPTPEDEGIPDHEDEELPLPGDRPKGANDRVTVREQMERESIPTRVAREIPEDARPAQPPEVGRLVDEPTEDGDDVTDQMVAEESDDVDALSPEEAAMHVEDETS